MMFAVTGIVGGDRAFQWITRQLARVTPAETGNYLSQFVREITNRPRPGMLSVGALLTFWSASAVFVALGRPPTRVGPARIGRRRAM